MTLHEWGAPVHAALVPFVITTGGIAMFSLFRKNPSHAGSSTSRAEVEVAHGAPAATYDEEERATLLSLARLALTQAVTEGMLRPVPDGIAPKLREPRGCFVTLEKKHQLRGCIGHIFAKEPLVQAVMENARNAALRDSRFPPVTADELPDITLEISVLSAPEPLSFAHPDDLLDRLRPDIDGVVLEMHGHRSTFLPQVWEKLPDKERFLDHLAAKAGLAPSAWRAPGVTISTYQAEVFFEAESAPKLW